MIMPATASTKTNPIQKGTFLGEKNGVGGNSDLFRLSLTNRDPWMRE